MKEEKEMKVSELAVILNKNFDRIEKRLDKIEDGQKRLETGQKEIKQDLAFTARKFEMKELESRVEKLEYKMAKMAK